MDLPTIFTSPYASSVAPTDCCCGNNPGLQINLTPAPIIDPVSGQIVTRMDQASAIIAAANARGFPIFQGA